jgi:hypothetical protein
VVNLLSDYFGTIIPANTGACHYSVTQTQPEYTDLLYSPNITSIITPSEPLFIYQYIGGIPPHYNVVFTSSYINEAFINLVPATYITKDNGLLFWTNYNALTSIDY